MLKLKCYICKKELDENGAEIISPPVYLYEVKKYNICCECFNDIMAYIEIDLSE